MYNERVRSEEFIHAMLLIQQRDAAPHALFADIVEPIANIVAVGRGLVGGIKSALIYRTTNPHQDFTLSRLNNHDAKPTLDVVSVYQDVVSPLYHSLFEIHTPHITESGRSAIRTLVTKVVGPHIAQHF